MTARLSVGERKGWREPFAATKPAWQEAYERTGRATCGGIFLVDDASASGLPDCLAAA